ncbi:MAG: type II secretion system protein GspG [Nitrospirales bacterium]|jgi:general secretion pathway protein G|nr:MAG: type II secretion system protein GspG [Nitrospirales bacterium]
MNKSSGKWSGPGLRILSPNGFTFIELMVVVAILAILIAIVAPRIMGRTDEARQTATLLQLRNLEQALQLYNLDNGFFPTTEQGLQALVEQPSTGKIPLQWKEGGYLAKVPKDAWGRPFLYLSPGGQDAAGSLREYDLLSYGSDGEPGGKGKHADITSWDLDVR